MSKYSGRYDFYDEISMTGIDNILKKTVYLGNSREPLELHSLCDCAPYFAHIPALSSRKFLKLSERSWVDTEEEETLAFYANRIQREYLKCKKKKIPFDMKSGCPYIIEGIYDELLRRIEEAGSNKISLDGLHLPLSDAYRMLLREDIERGFD